MTTISSDHVRRAGRRRRLSGLVVLAAAVGLLASVPARADDGLRLAYFQGLVGAAGYDEDRLSFAETAPGDPDRLATNDLSSMPCIGVAGQFPLSASPSHVGLDLSLLVGWRSDDTSIVAGNGQARVKIDSDLWLADVAIGLYAQTLLGERWRLYAAAGPLLLFGEYSDDTTEEDLSATPVAETEGSSSDSAFGVGGYAKFGLEYHLSADALFGVAVRGIATDLEFDRAGDDGGLSGVQGFVTFTRAY